MSNFAVRRTTMVDTQVRPSDVTKFPIIDAMLNVQREDFVPRDQREAAYIGENLTVAEGRVLLEPRTLAKMLDALDIAPDQLVLDIGCALGYSSAVIARLAEAVVAVEEEPSLVRELEEALNDASVDNVMVFDGTLAAGAAEHGPYDVIVIQGGVHHVPEELLQQLKDGARIAALFVENAVGDVRIGYKNNGVVSWRSMFHASAPILPGFETTTEFRL